MKNVFAFAPIAALAVAGGIAFALPSFAQETGSAASAGGMCLIAKPIASGRITRSSSRPRTGMKSGIRSIGLKA